MKRSETKFPTSPSSTSWRRGFLLVTVTLLAVSGVAMAQDADDDGVLPFTGGGSKIGGDTGTAASTASATVTVSGSVVEPALDPTRARIAFTTGLDQIEMQPVEDGETAVFSEAGEGLFAESDGVEVRIQGVGELSLPEVLSARFEVAPIAGHRLSVLVFDDGSEPLSSVLAGQTQPDLVHVVGDAESVDLDAFHRIVASHADDLPGIRVTWVFGSIDADGEPHLAAVGATTAGGPLDVLID